MKKVLLTIFAMAIAVTTIAQQDPHYSHFMFNQTSYNPAYCGIDGVINGTVIYRNQWMGMDGGPNTMMLCGDMPIRLL